MNKPNLFWGCKDGSVSANQSMWYITLKMKNKSYDFLSFAKKLFDWIQHPFMIKTPEWIEREHTWM